MMHTEIMALSVPHNLASPMICFHQEVAIFSYIYASLASLFGPCIGYRHTVQMVV